MSAVEEYRATGIVVEYGGEPYIEKALADAALAEETARAEQAEAALADVRRHLERRIGEWDDLIEWLTERGEFWARAGIGWRQSGLRHALRIIDHHDTEVQP